MRAATCNGRNPGHARARAALFFFWAGGDNMDVGTITQLIGSLGFPIAACVALFWQNAKQSEKHAEELRQITEALNNNTIALTELSAKIGGMS